MARPLAEVKPPCLPPGSPPSAWPPPSTKLASLQAPFASLQAPFASLQAPFASLQAKK
ncbi:MAG: hypothetical protein IJ066_08070 [Bacteroidaceae bacterium]|nr:hypothetical protein [Bacteroidaceae bacterium]